jgi:opacity protein-like surface antigen
MILLRARLAMSSAVLLASLFVPATARAQADMSRAVPPPGKALVFVYRSDRQAVAGRLPVLVNAQPAGELVNGTYLVVTVDPGRTYLRVGDRVITSLNLVAASRQSYFVSVTAVPGLLPLRGELRHVGEADGRRALQQSRFVGAGAPATAAAPRAPQPSVAPRPPVVGAAPVAPPRAPRPSAAPAPRAAVPPPPRPAAPPPAARPAAPVAKAPVRPRAPAPAAADEWSLALIAKLGTFKMASASQTVGTWGSTFDTSSSPVGGIELEMRRRDGLALGGEVFYYKNDLTNTDPNPVNPARGQTGQQTVTAFMLNGKYYFQVEPWLYPYAGVGLGFASSSYGGNLSGSASGLAYQGIAGVDFRFGDIGFYLQYKHLGSTVGSAEKVKVGGSGILVGASFVF